MSLKTAGYAWPDRVSTFTASQTWCRLGAALREPGSRSEFSASLWWATEDEEDSKYPQGVWVSVRLPGGKKRARLAQYLKDHGSQIYGQDSDSWAVYR